MSSLTSLDLTPLDTSKVTNMSYMFSGMGNLTEIMYGSKFVYKNGAYVSSMFTNCLQINQLVHPGRSL